MAPRNINPVFFRPLKAGTERGEEVNLGLTLNSPPVIVRSLKHPVALELERGRAEVSRPRWSTEQWEKDESRGWGGGCVLTPVPAYRSSPCTDISQNSRLCYYCVLLCAQRWMGSAFRVTKSLGMHTGAGSGNSNTALSWAVKEDNTRCPLWTGLASTKIPIFCSETSPQVILAERTFLFQLFIYFLPQPPQKIADNDTSASLYED